MQRHSPTGLSEDDPNKMATKVWATGAELFRKHGYSATTTRQLADRLGITPATLYYYIGNKEDLLAKICREALSLTDAPVRSALADVEDPLERIQTLVKAHLLAMTADINLHSTMLLEFESLTVKNRK